MKTDSQIKVALAGNPNSGKTTLFNELTGARQHVGNYPGVTVEKKEGIYHAASGEEFHLVDLPGTYSLTAYSLEEVVARDYLIEHKPQAVINVLDASNLERNLYLTLQFLEMEFPVCIALNMMDMAENRGFIIDQEKLSSLLGVPVVPTVARTGKGKAELMKAAAEISAGAVKSKPVMISYGDDIDLALEEMSLIIQENSFLTDKYPVRWLGLKYLEQDEIIIAQGDEENKEISEKIKAIERKVAEHIKGTLNTYPEAVITDHRYGFIKSLIRSGVLKKKNNEDRLYLSDKIDTFLTNRYLGPVFMLGVILGLYQFTFSFSEIPVGWLESLFGWIGDTAYAYLPDGYFKSMVISGIIDGVGGVLGFVPLIMFMFLGIAFLEDSGYLARVAFMLDRVFRMFGLHGSSVMPFIISGGIAGGCAVPGVMAARTLKSPKERLATLLTVPFMNCGAKIPVFALLVAAFFSENEAFVMFSITMISWAGALIAAKILRMTVIKGESTPFVMELPPYRIPTMKGLAIHTWERTWQYIKKAGTVILGISILLWAMMTFPELPQSQVNVYENKIEAITAQYEGTEMTEDAQAQVDAISAELGEKALVNSIAGRMGTALEPVTKFAGFDWRTNIALVGGFAAKEVLVTTLSTAYSLGGLSPEESTPLSEKLAASPDWNPLKAFSLILFVIFYAPCFVTVVCIARETGTWKWAFFSIVFNTALAYLISVSFYQIGRLTGFMG